MTSDQVAFIIAMGRVSLGRVICGLVIDLYLSSICLRVFPNRKPSALTMSVDDLVLDATAHKEKKQKKSKTKTDDAMDVTHDGENTPNKKRKADELEGGDDEGLSKKERKRLRKLAKEQAKAEDSAAPKDEEAALAKREKKEKKRKLKEQVGISFSSRCVFTEPRCL